MAWRPIQGVFSPCAQYSQNSFCIHHDPDQEKEVTEKWVRFSNRACLLMPVCCLEWKPWILGPRDAAHVSRSICWAELNKSCCWFRLLVRSAGLGPHFSGYYLFWIMLITHLTWFIYSCQYFKKKWLRDVFWFWVMCSYECVFRRWITRNFAHRGSLVLDRSNHL